MTVSNNLYFWSQIILKHTQVLQSILQTGTHDPDSAAYISPDLHTVVVQNKLLGKWKYILSTSVSASKPDYYQLKAFDKSLKLSQTWHSGVMGYEWDPLKMDHSWNHPIWLQNHDVNRQSGSISMMQCDLSGVFAHFKSSRSRKGLAWKRLFSKAALPSEGSTTTGKSNEIGTMKWDAGGCFCTFKLPWKGLKEAERQWPDIKTRHRTKCLCERPSTHTSTSLSKTGKYDNKSWRNYTGFMRLSPKSEPVCDISTEKVALKARSLTVSARLVAFASDQHPFRTPFSSLAASTLHNFSFTFKTFLIMSRNPPHPRSQKTGTITLPSLPSFHEDYTLI